jgi:hypothetical protein
MESAPPFDQAADARLPAVAAGGNPAARIVGLKLALDDQLVAAKFTGGIAAQSSSPLAQSSARLLVAAVPLRQVVAMHLTYPAEGVLPAV